MANKVVGVKDTIYDFVDKAGRPVHSEGKTIYVEFESNKIVGIGCQAQYLSYEKLGGYDPQVGDNIEWLYNGFKKVVGVKLL